MKDPGRPHQHTYDAEGRMTCCTLEDRIYANAGAEELVGPKVKSHAQKPTDGAHAHDHADGTMMQLLLPSAVSLILLLTALVFDHSLKPGWFSGWPRFIWYVIAYIPVGAPVLKQAVRSISRRMVFSEFMLMGLATLGAFAIGEYPEGVAVMLFYGVGEVFQTLAVRRATTNIRSLLDQRPDEATILQAGQPRLVKAQEVGIGDIIQLKPGEKLALDGVLRSPRASFNTAALTGESKPDTKAQGEAVLAGMINLNTVAQVEVTTAYTDSKLSRILELVEEASARKAPTELFIRRFAKVYTPVVVLLAALICLLPYFLVADYRFSEWLYRALVFLVISCPCALVIAIPLGYFGGIGAASRNGILVKGGNFLDLLANTREMMLDKTGTLTQGVFQVQEAVFAPGINPSITLALVNALEAHSDHPIAAAIHAYVGPVDHGIELVDVEEIPGHGLRALVNGKELLVGNFRLMDRYSILYEVDPGTVVHTVVAVAHGGRFMGHITIADRLKADARATIDRLHAQGLRTTMLSGDTTMVVQVVADELGIDSAFGDLLPADKMRHVQAIQARNRPVAFVGDGLNDAPVIALSDVGIAMGGLGSDASIETADVVIQDDQPSKIPVAIDIGRRTKGIVWQNVILAFAVKGTVLALAAGGLAAMWEAVFADVGVALLAILNAVRIQRMRFVA